MTLTDKFGINAQRGEVTSGDLDAFQAAGFHAVRFQCGGGHSPTTVHAYRSRGARILHACIYVDDMNVVARTPENFLAGRIAHINTMIEAGVGVFEIHAQPNRARYGFGLSWETPLDFAEWFLAALRGLQAAVGPGRARFGFPALSPGPADFTPDAQAGGRAYRPWSDVDFLEVCRSAVEAADFLAVITHWDSADSMRSYDPDDTGAGGLRFVRHYHERFPNKPIVVSRFSNERTDLDDKAPDSPVWREIGEEYAEFLTLCAQYEWIEAVYGHTLRDATRYPNQSWIAPDQTRRRVLEGVNTRPRLPSRAQLSLRWPTQYQQVNQVYGVRQLDYARYSGGYLHGGHEGIDLAAPDGSEIYACLRGVVSRSEATRGNAPNGYGNYGEVISIASDVPGVGRITLTYAHLGERDVAVGDIVQAGQRIGKPGETGNAQGVHLHLSMRIYGVPLYAQLDYLNPGLYLDYDTAPEALPPPALGAPRVQYPRSYILIPPPAGIEWVEAVLRATWDRYRVTVGGSADDAALGDLDRRRVIAVNPEGWPGDLGDWYATNYPGVEYRPIRAPNPAALDVLLRGTNFAQAPPASAGPRRGRPLSQYSRTYILIPTGRGSDWAIAAARATWARHRMTIGGSADDAGVGALDARRVVAINPTEWGGGDLEDWYNLHYAGVAYSEVHARSPSELQTYLTRMFP